MKETLGSYRVLEPIGSGGMGVVYRARDERLERDVALKVLSADRTPDEESRRRFRREALALSRLNHPNIATIHAFETFGDLDVLVMELIPGRDLADLVREGPLPEREVVRLGVELLGALEAAHEQGVIHRDLKPGNVRVTPSGRLKVLDFGLARAERREADATTETLTAPGFVGTLPYMAPEQVRGKAVDARTDIYGAGAVLFEAATGSRVHPGLSGARLLGAILDEPVLPARSVNPRVSVGLETVLCKALDPDPERRYQSAREMRVDLERLASPSIGVPQPIPAPPTRWRRWAALGVLALVTTAAAWLLWPRNEPFAGRILVADIDNRTGDAELGPLLRELVTLQLQQSRHLNLISRQQVADALRRMGRSDTDPLDLDSALELAEREAIPLVLAGTAVRRSDSIVLAINGIDSVSHASLFTATTDYASEQDIGDRVERLASDIRRALGESLEGISLDTQPLHEVTTRSLHALKLYSGGAEAIRRGESDVAVGLLTTALEIDPSFAMAHRMMARAYETTGNRVQERAHLDQAYELRDRLTRRERLHVEASYFKGRGEYERAVGVLTAAINLFPGDGEARYELALAYRDAGQSARAIEHLEALLAIDPSFSVAYGITAQELARVGEYERARAVQREAQARNVKGPQLIWAEGLILLGVERVDEARQQFRALEASSRAHAGVARLMLATADILEGRMLAAAERLQADVLADRRSGEFAAEARRRELLGHILQLRGSNAEALAQASAILGAGRDQLGPNEWLIAGSLLAASGDAGQASGPLAELDELRSSGASGFVESCYQNLAGEIALAEGRFPDAVQAFTSAANHYPRTVSTYGLARAFAGLEDWERARDTWSRAIEARGRFLHEGLAAEWVLSHLERARANRALGDTAAAQIDYDRFFDLWRNGDDLPIKREADVERRALAAQ